MTDHCWLHAQHGLWFCRQAHGHVRLVRMAKGRPEDLDRPASDAVAQVDITLPARVWCMVVGAMAQPQAELDLQDAAEALHGLGAHTVQIVVGFDLADPTEEWAGASDAPALRIADAP